MQPKTITATGQYDLTDASVSYIACVAFTVYGFTGSLVPQIKADPEGQGIAPNYFNCGYTNLATGTYYSAGTAITADGMYITDATAAIVSLNVTDAGDGNFNVWAYPREGPAPSGTSSGTSGTIVGTDADNATNSTTKVPVIPGRANAADPSWTEGHEVPSSMDLLGNTRVKVNVALPAGNNNIGDVDVLTLPALVAGSAIVGKVGGITRIVQPAVTVTASAYATGNCWGGKSTLTNALGSATPSTGAWSLLTLTMHTSSPPVLDCLLFGANPSATFTDKSAFPTLSAADNLLVVARISIASTDWATIGGSSFATIKVGGLPISATTSGTLYSAFNVVSGTPTPAATTDFSALYTFFTDQ